MEACRNASGCAPLFCETCSCTPTWMGCYGPNDLPPLCPQVDCMSPVCCSSDAHCSPFPYSICAPPGTPRACGACNTFPGNCVQDADCDPARTGNICDPMPCSCTAERHCTPGCSVSSPCEQGQSCNLATKRCEVQRCTGGIMCPSTFACLARVCARKTCAGDLDCGDGFCVVGQCYDSRGTCGGPVP